MTNINDKLIDEIVESCLKIYQNLPKSGKPLAEEWTVLSCVVQYNSEINEHKVISLGTGSKCIGASKMSPTGKILNDSHAEIFARRGFLIYVYENIMSLLDEEESIFVKDGEKFKLKDNIEFIYYSSQMPCGDASIIPIKGEEDDFGSLILGKRSAVDDNCEIETKKLKNDIHRTGAKCLPNAQQDPKGPGDSYHIIGKVRTKPGRGDRTLSVSCSDKMARWIHLGIQGSLLDMLLCKPLTIKCFIFGAGVPYSIETLHRALLVRDSNLSIDERLKEIPKFYKSSIKFSQSRGTSNIRPAAASILWVNTFGGINEVAVQGLKLGVTKKKANLGNNGLCISKYNLFKKFQEVLLKSDKLRTYICGNESLSDIPYNEMKKRSTRYQAQWSNIKEKFFKTWTVKPDMWNFKINVNG